jgi:hypothetical protein
MLERCTGVQVQHLQPGDLNPVRVWNGLEDKTLRVRDRIVKSYENLRVVYEIETRLRDLQDQQEAANAQPRRSRAVKEENRGARTVRPGGAKATPKEGNDK